MSVVGELFCPTNTIIGNYCVPKLPALLRTYATVLGDHMRPARLMCRGRSIIAAAPEPADGTA
eukprot:scaffold6855_cov126-Isochrysis_galbana.AAC.3